MIILITCVIQSLQEYEKVLDVFSITLMRSQAEVEVNIIVTKHNMTKHCY